MEFKTIGNDEYALLLYVLSGQSFGNPRAKELEHRLRASYHTYEKLVYELRMAISAFEETKKEIRQLA